MSYGTTTRDESFKGTTAPLMSVAALVAEIVTHPEKHVRVTFGVNKPAPMATDRFSRSRPIQVARSFAHTAGLGSTAPLPRRR